MELSRRQLLVGAALGGGLVVAWGCAASLAPASAAGGRGGLRRLDQGGARWCGHRQRAATGDGAGISTQLAQIAALELGADWRQMGVVFAPVSEIFANAPLAARWAELWLPMARDNGVPSDNWLARHWAEAHRFTATADGLSLAAYEAPLRHAAAGARALLVKAAARRWGVNAEDCTVSGGLVHHGPQSLTFGALAQEASG
jgi:isoquinoline 1-oxidoreductase beta subunit